MDIFKAGWPPSYAAARLSRTMKVPTRRNDRNVRRAINYIDVMEANQNIAPARIELCNEQPLPLMNLHSVPVDQPNTSVKGDVSDDPFCNEPAWTSNAVNRPPSLKPLDFGDSSLLGRWPYQGKQKNLTGQGHGTRPSISTPYNFRRLDHTESQIQSLVPLRLGPVVLRESPGPNADIAIPETRHVKSRSDSTQNLLSEVTQAESYRLNRETPFQRCQQRSSGVWPLAPQQAHIDSSVAADTVDATRSIRPSLSSRSRSTGSLRRSGTEKSMSSLSSRPSSERLHPKRKRSFQSVRRTFGEDDEDIEKEIVELNTIVEERRAEQARDGSPDQHVAAVAPSMQIPARSETLDAIGSALSRPVTSRTEHRPSGSLDSAPEWFVRRSTSTNTRISTRVSGWLSGMFPSVSAPQLPSGEPFYKCQPPSRPLQRPYSESSITASLTEMDSPSLTAASSPTTRGHSRSHTGESRMTPILPTAMYAGQDYFDDRKSAYQNWPIATTPTSQVGLAI